MWLQEVEGRTLEQFVYDGVSLAAADSMRRLPPFHRDLFDDFVFTASAVAVGESDWARFPIACMGYLSAVHGDLTVVPPLIPPDTAAVVRGCFPDSHDSDPVTHASRMDHASTRSSIDLPRTCSSVSVLIVETAYMRRARGRTAG